MRCNSSIFPELKINVETPSEILTLPLLLFLAILTVIMDPAGKTFANRSITNELALFIVEQFAVLATEAAGDIGPTALAEFNPPVETITFAGVGIN